MTLAVFFLIGKRGHHRIAISWLVAASLFFYGWWNPAYLGLVLISMLFNYAVGVSLASQHRSVVKSQILTLGIACNLGLLGYYKYANFFVENLNKVAGSDFNLETIILPLAISFFTFQQIAYLVDAYKGETREYNFLHYCLFVTFFPQLIAGPIVHHKEMLPQFARDWIYRLSYENIAVGMTIFSLGLFKKVVLADGVSIYATPVFDASEAGIALTFFEAWTGALAYTLQLYFDFSGYSDMAIGLARMFGIRLPLNFSSPYKAKNIIEFWRCWHMTLSRFLRDYLYIPLGGNRKGTGRRHVNLMLTMLLGGLWHGAGWTFVIWGGLHGMYLIINHMWHATKRSLGMNDRESFWFGKVFARLLTFSCIVMAWVFFRADSLDGAVNISWAMIGGNGISLPPSVGGRMMSMAPWLAQWGVSFEGMFSNGLMLFNDGLILIAGLLLVVWCAPSTQQMIYRYEPALEVYSGEIRAPGYAWFAWKPNWIWMGGVMCMLLYSLYSMQNKSEFLYFQF